MVSTSTSGHPSSRSPGRADSNNLLPEATETEPVSGTLITTERCLDEMFGSDGSGLVAGNTFPLLQHTPPARGSRDDCDQRLPVPDGSDTSPLLRLAMHKNLHFLPIAACIIVLTTVIVTYVWAVLLGHVEAGFPYISDTGSLPPESCFFSFMLNISALLLACCVYIQYRRIGVILASSKQPGVMERRNTSSAWTGAVSCLGLCIIANFQEFNASLVHLAGSTFCYVGATAYFCWQTWFTRRLQPYRPVNRVLLRVQLVFCLVCLVLIPVIIVTTITAVTQFNGVSKLRWGQQDGGWVFHVVSACSEWLMTACFCSFMLFLAHDFKHTSIAAPAIAV